MNCEHVEHMLVERAEGLLDERSTAELEAHLASCESCRRAAVEFGDLAGRLALAGAAFGAMALHIPTETPTEAPTGAIIHEAGRVPRLPRASRRRRVLRWVAPLAGAAAVGAAILFPLGVFDRKAGSAEAATSLTLMSEALEGVQRVAFAVQFVPDDGPILSGRLIVVEALIRVDMPDGRIIVSDTVSGRTQIRLPNERKFIEAPEREASSPVDLYEKLVKLAENPSEDLGIEVLDGIPARVFVVRGVNGPLDASEYKVWINPHTQLPMKVEMPGRTAEVASVGVAGRLVLTQFLFGADVDVALVNLTPPTEYVEAPITADPRATQVEVSVSARSIMMGLVMIQADTGQWPDSLQALVDGGQMTPQRMRNVRAPEGAENFGWIYFRPTADAVEYDPHRVVVAEPAPEPWTQAVVAFADGHVEVVADRERYATLVAAAGGVPPEAPSDGKPALDRSSAATVDPTKPEDGPGTVRLGGRLPLVTLNKDDLQGLSAEGAALTEGEARFDPARLRENAHLPRELQVNRFATSHDTIVATLPMGPDNTVYGLLSDAAATIDRTKAPVLMDRVGQRYPALGYVHSTGREIRIRYFPSKPIGSINELPTISASKPDEKLYLVFQVSAGAELTGLAIGDKLVASFKPALPTKR